MAKPLLLLLLLLLAASFCAAVKTAPSDLAAIRALAAALPFTASLGWSPSTDPCSSWAHVTCSPSGHVTAIQLTGLHISPPPSKPLPPSILSNLTALTRLELPSLSLPGPLPSLSTLTALQFLLLHDNLFTSIPPNLFASLASLQAVSLDHNPFAPWSLADVALNATSSSLVNFSASYTNLTGAVPEALPLEFVSLRRLDLSNNYLTGEIPTAFGGSGIAYLYLNNQHGTERLSGGIDVVGNMTSLVELSLQSNDLSGPLPEFGQLTSLRFLSLRDNRLTGIVPDSLTSLKSLERVVLTNNLLQGPAPRFGDQVATDIDPRGESFCHNSSDPCDPRVSSLLKIAGSVGYPRLFAESWKGNDPCAGWVGISCDGAGHITVVNFIGRNLSGVISPEFGSISSLQRILLARNNLVGTIPPGLVNLKFLKELDVSNNSLWGKVPGFSSNVIVRTDGNPNIGEELGPSPSGPGGTNSDNSDGSETGGKGKSNRGIIIGCVVAGIIVVVIGLVGFCCWKRKKGLILGRPQNPSNVLVHPQNSAVESGAMVISLQVLREVTNNFSEDNILGRGGFGTVYRGQLPDGTNIAVKRMESGVMDSKGLSEFESEISVLTKVRHRHLVSLLGYCLEGRERILVFEYMPQGTLSHHLFNWMKAGLKPLEWKKRLNIALDVARGVEYLHSLANQSFIHRDLKPSNILLGDDMKAKVADFGLVRLAPEGKYGSVETRLAGTFGYLAPEYATTGRVTTKADVYSFGVILMELITGRKALDNSQPEESMHLVTWFRRMQLHMNTFREAIDPTINIEDKETFDSIITVAELAGHCCSRTPYQRPDMGYAVNTLSSIAERWMPSDTITNLEDGYVIDLDMTLPEALKKWQAFEDSTSQIDARSSSEYFVSKDNTHTSLPIRPDGFAETFTSSDGR